MGTGTCEGCMDVTGKLVWSIVALANFSAFGQPGLSLSAFRPFSAQPLCSLSLPLTLLTPPFYSPVLPGGLCPWPPSPWVCRLSAPAPTSTNGFPLNVFAHIPERTPYFHPSDHRPLWIGFPQPRAQPLSSPLRLWACPVEPVP